MSCSQESSPLLIWEQIQRPALGTLLGGFGWGEGRRRQLGDFQALPLSERGLRCCEGTLALRAEERPGLTHGQHLTADGSCERVRGSVASW